MKKEDLLRLLDDTAVQEKIRKIVSTSNSEELNLESKLSQVSKSEIELLKESVKSLENEKNELEKQNKNYQEKIKFLEISKNSAEKKAKDAKAELGVYRKSFDECLKIYGIYKDLALETKKQIATLFPKDDLISFLVSGFQWFTISSLYKLLKSMLIEGKTGDVDKLISICETLFITFNEKDSAPKYTVINPKNGENFDSTKHSVLGDAKGTRIAKTSLFGYMDNSTGKTEKAFVQVT